MRLTYDAEADVVYIEFAEADVTTRHVADEISLDYDGDGRLAGIEILGASVVISDPAALERLAPESSHVGSERSHVGPGSPHCGPHGVARGRV